MRHRCVRMLVAAAATIAVVAHGSPAGAAALTDANETGGRLDLRRLRAIRDNGPMYLVVKTYQEWGRGLLRRGRPNRLVVLFDTNLDGRVDYRGRIVQEEPGAPLLMNICGQGDCFESLTGTRPHRDTVRFTVPGSSPPNPRRAIQVAVLSRFHREGTVCDPGCGDRAPDPPDWLFLVRQSDDA